MGIKRLNHAVLFVSDAVASAKFYADVLGFKVVSEEPRMNAVFMRAEDSDNHHDLGLFGVGAQPARPRGSLGLYHLAWEVQELDQLVEIERRLVAANAYVGASDHGVSKSLYGADPDGIEFEVMWAVAEEDWGDYATKATIAPLDLDAELAQRRQG